MANGYLFGYPDYAVDFFSNAKFEIDSIQTIINRANDTIKIPHYKKDRKFVKIQIYKPNRYFSYAIPIENELTQEDKLIMQKAEIILQKYKQIRPNYINGQKFDAISLIQDWYWENNNTLDGE